MPASASMTSAVLAPVTTASFDVRAKRFTALTAPGSARYPDTAISARFSATASAISWVHRHRQRVVARDDLVDLVPRVSDDELPLLRGHLGAVAAHRQHDRFDVLAFAVDQRAVEIEQKGVRGCRIHATASTATGRRHVDQRSTSTLGSGDTSLSVHSICDS